MTRKVGGGEVIWFGYTVHFFTFSQTKICWNKQNTLHSKTRIWYLGVLTMQKFINIALAVLKIFKVVKSTTFPTTFDTNQIWCKWGRKQKWSCSFAVDLLKYSMPFPSPETLFTFVWKVIILLNRFFPSWLS